MSVVLSGLSGMSVAFSLVSVAGTLTPVALSWVGYSWADAPLSLTFHKRAVRLYRKIANLIGEASALNMSGDVWGGSSDWISRPFPLLILDNSTRGKGSAANAETKPY